jgi:hypothetical protein
VAVCLGMKQTQAPRWVLSCSQLHVSVLQKNTSCQLQCSRLQDGIDLVAVRTKQWQSFAGRLSCMQVFSAFNALGAICFGLK